MTTTTQQPCNLHPAKMKYLDAMNTITPATPRQPLGPQHQTEHYRITEWIAPQPDMPYHLFTLKGPGADGRVFIGMEEFCGPEHIRSLERAWCAGWSAAAYFLAAEA